MEHWSLIAEACDRKLEKSFSSRVFLFCLGIILDPLTLFSKMLDKIGISYPPADRNSDKRNSSEDDATE